MATRDTVIVYGDVEKDYNKQFVAFLEELEEKMPHSYQAINIEADGAQILMQIDCATKEDLATIAQELYKFRTVIITDISKVSEEIYKVPEPIIPEGATPTPTPADPSPTPSITPTPIWYVTTTIEMVYREAVNDVAEVLQDFATDFGFDLDMGGEQ